MHIVYNIHILKVTFTQWLLFFVKNHWQYVNSVTPFPHTDASAADEFWKQCGKRRNYSQYSIYPFVTMFSICLPSCIQSRLLHVYWVWESVYLRVDLVSHTYKMPSFFTGAYLSMQPPILTQVVCDSNVSFERKFVVCSYLSTDVTDMFPKPTNPDVFIKTLPGMTVFVKSFKVCRRLFTKVF